MAAGSVIGALRVLLGLDTAQFDTGVKSVQGKLSLLSGAFAKFAGGFISAVSLGGIAIGFKKIADHMEEVGAAAQRLGIPVKELSRLQLAAQLSEVSFDQLSTSVSRLARNITSAATGATSEASRAFKSLGIDVNQTGLTVTDVLMKVADQFSHMPDGIQKTALAIQIFGRGGAALIPLLNQGSAAIKKMTDESDALGVTIDRFNAQAADDFNDNLDRIGAALRGVAQTIVVRALPGLIDLTNKIVEFATKSNAAVNIGDLFSNFLKNIAGDAMRAASAFTQISIALEAIKKALPQNIGEAIGTLTQAYHDITAETDRLNASLVELNKQESTGRAHMRTMADSVQNVGQELDLVTEKSEKAGVTFAKMFLNLQQSATAISTQIQGIGLTAGALARLNAEQEFYNKLQDESITLTPTQTAQVKAQLDIIASQTERLNSLQDVFGVLSNGFSSLADGLVSAARGTESFGQVFKTTIDSIIQDLARLFVNKFLQMLLGQGFGALFGGAGGGPTSIIPVGFKAGGGSVSAGKPYVVGERGPEMFVPRSSGSIVPNSQMGYDIKIIDQRTTASPPVESRTGADGSQEFVIRDTIRRQLPGELSKLVPAQFGAKPRLQQRG